jgi:hypothetical protein
MDGLSNRWSRSWVSEADRNVEMAGGSSRVETSFSLWCALVLLNGGIGMTGICGDSSRKSVSSAKPMSTSRCNQSGLSDMIDAQNIP